MIRKAFLAACFTLAALSGEAAPAAYVLKVKDGTLSGNGAELLRNSMTNAQFILWGEDHCYADSAVLLRAIAREARPLGFKYHVVEVGPLSTRIVERTFAGDGVRGVQRLVHAHPLALPFLSLKDDLLLAGDFTGRDANGMPYLWGIDQEFIGSPALHLARLVELATSDEARNEALRLRDNEYDAAARADQARFLLSSASPATFEKLDQLFAANPEAARIIAELRESAAIYQAWASNHNYENNAHRAELLARNFLQDYRSAAEPSPKIVFKMGLEHVALGTTTVNVVDLGTLATELARANGHSALRIAFLPAGGKHVAFAPRPNNPTTISDFDSEETTDFLHAIGLDPKELPQDGFTLVPLEPVRKTLDTKGIDALKPFARFVLLGYDYLVTTPSAKPAVFLY